MMSRTEIAGPDTFLWSGPNRGLMLAVWWNVVLLALSASAYPLDRRTVLGINPWIKPIKFELSVIIFCLTVALLLSAVGRRGDWTKMRQVIGWGIGIAMSIENTIICMQSARGVRSHMNFSSLFDGVAFGVMGLFILLTTILLGVLLVLYLVTRTGLPQALTWGIVLGLAAALAGSYEGFLMVGKYQAHTVGAVDGGPGLPFVNWSILHGDLRVAHFLALHALQLLPLAGWLLSRTRLPQWTQLTCTAGFAALYTAVTAMLFVQAVRGRPLIASATSSGVAETAPQASGSGLSPGRPYGPL